MENIDLLINQINKIHVHTSKLTDIKKELEDFLKITNIDNIKFAKDVMLSEEIKSNNLIEGYFDDLDYIYDVVNSKNANNSKDQRILNLYNGYKYILKNKEINKNNLKKLYNFLSKNLLSSYDLNHMGEFYRDDKVFIYCTNNINNEPDEGIDKQEIDKYMNNLFEYINKNNDLNSKTDYYIKSQIMHFYFVYIHPYFDVNGRTSRTTSMWYLLNNEIYPYIIFNRGINYDKSTYYKSILETKKFGNITIFLKYMLTNVKTELEKEYLIMNIESLTEHLSIEEKQTLNYILSMNGEKNLKTFLSFYKRFNETKSLKGLNEQVLDPLFEKKILLKGEDTKSKIYDGNNNFRFSINKNYLDNDPNKIKRLSI